MTMRTVLLVLLHSLLTIQLKAQLCDTISSYIQPLADYPSSYIQLEANNYCDTITPVSTNITISFGLIATHTSTYIGVGYSAIGCNMITNSNSFLVDGINCDTVGYGELFNNLIPNRPYIWTTTFTATGGVCFGISTICPYYIDLNFLSVDLGEFIGYLNGNQVSLRWSTMSEQNAHYFMIERSDDSFQFKSIGEVLASGNTTLQTYYQYDDKNPLIGNNYYRLVEVDYNGEKTTFPPIAIFYKDTQVIRTINMLGQIVPNGTYGPVFIMFDNGTVVYRFNPQ